MDRLSTIGAVICVVFGDQRKSNLKESCTILRYGLDGTVVRVPGFNRATIMDGVWRMHCRC